MTDPLTVNAHAEAFLDLLRADAGPPPLVVLDGVVPHGVLAPYVLVYFTINTPSGPMPIDSTSYDLDSDRVVLTGYCHNVGETPSAARIVTGRTRAAVLNVTPTIAGRECWPIRQMQTGQPPRPDESTGTPVMDQIDMYRLESIPA